MKNLILTMSLLLGLATSASALVASKRDGFSRECKELVIKVDLMVQGGADTNLVRDYLSTKLVKIINQGYGYYSFVDIKELSLDLMVVYYVSQANEKHKLLIDPTRIEKLKKFPQAPAKFIPAWTRLCNETFSPQ